MNMIIEMLEKEEYADCTIQKLVNDSILFGMIYTHNYTGEEAKRQANLREERGQYIRVKREVIYIGKTRHISEQINSRK